MMCCFCFRLKVIIIAQRPNHYVVEHTIATIVFPTENFQPKIFRTFFKKDFHITKCVIKGFLS